MKTIVQQILTNSFKKAKRIPLNKHSKIIIFSDVHRGDNSYTDDFAHNKTIYTHALKTYYKGGFSYFKLGDGFELLENRNFNEIFNNYKSILLQLQDFHKAGKLHFLWGNHDMIFKKNKRIKKYFNFYKDEITGEKKRIFKKHFF